MEHISFRKETFNNLQEIEMGMKESTLFRDAFGDSSQVRILEYMLECGNLDYSLSDIARGADVGRTTLFRLWGPLVASKIVVQTRTIGNAKLFTLNTKHPLVTDLKKLFKTILLEGMKKRRIS